MKPLKLNLGSNDTKSEGFVNVDIRKIPEVDIVDDITELSTIDDNSIEEIHALNILEHVSPDRTEQTLALWARKLNKGGIIIIGVPDGDMIFRRWIDKLMPWEDVIHDIFGNVGLLREWHGEDAEKYGHHTIFCKEYLQKLLTKSGFGDFKDLPPNHGAGFTMRATKL